jgi:hypothetical protein
MTAETCKLNFRLLKNIETFDDASIGACIIFFYFMYLELARTFLDVFNCEERIPSDGKSYMVSVKSEICGAEGGMQTALVPYAVIGLLVYCIGFPMAIGFLMWRNRADIDKMLRALHLTHQRKKDAHFPMTLRYRRFYNYFKPSCKYWNLVIMARKFFLASTSLLFHRNPTFQLSIALLGMFCAFVLQILYRPYWSVEEQLELVKKVRQRENKDRFDDKVKQFAAMQMQMQVKDFGRTTKLKQRGAASKVKVRSGNKNSGYANAGAAAASGKPTKVVETEEYEIVLKGNTSILFNLNTIESFMLATTVIVNLAGIMLSSGQFKDLVTAVVLTFIATCALLLFAGLAREIWLARNINSNMTKARWRIAIKRQIKINNKQRAHVKRFQNVVYEIMKKEGRSMTSVIMLAGFLFRLLFCTLLLYHSFCMLFCLFCVVKTTHRLFCIMFS